VHALRVGPPQIRGVFAAFKEIASMAGSKVVDRKARAPRAPTALFICVLVHVFVRVWMRERV
jgi:hypothetical protein